MPEPDTICGYGLADVRRSLRDAVDRREKRASQRWTAELIATPGAVGSLWASYWLAWAAAQGAGSASPTMPILLKQTWGTITDAAHVHVAEGDGWPAFRNDPKVRALAAEMTMRLLGQARQTPVVWPSKEIILYDVGNMRDASPPPAVDGPVVMRVWQREDDGMELRLMAGRWLTALENGDLRGALSIVAWSLLPQAQQGLQMPLKCAARGPAILPPKGRNSPIWFWFEIGRAALLARQGLHRGWPTMNAAVIEAFRLHYKRWSAADRMRVLLAWILQLRASWLPQPESLWAAPPIQQTLHEIDLPYKEIAAELADPNAPVIRHDKAPPVEEETKKTTLSRMEAKMAEADAKIMAMMGLTEDDI
jgi:hypothetical protein